VAMSTKSTVKANIPDMDSPQWATVSASRYPGCDSSHWLVRIGICFRKRVPGFVVDLPCFVYRIRTGFRSLSMVEGDILFKALIVSRGRGPNCSA
jgi:hypothetical protein